MNKKKIIFLGLLLFRILFFNAQKSVWTLQLCIDTALKRNIALNQGKITSEQSQISLQQSKDNLLPNLNLNDGHNFNFGRSLDPFSYQYINQAISANIISLTSNVVLFNGFQSLNTIRQNQFLYDASKKSIEKMKNNLSLNILAAYMNVLSAYESVALARTQAQSTGDQVSRTQKFVDAGKVAEIDLLQIQSQLAKDELAFVQAENQLRLAKVTLMQLMNIPVTADFEVERPQLVEALRTSLAAAEIYKIAEGILPEIQEAKLGTSAAEVSLRIAKALYLPKLSASGTLKTGYSSTSSNVTTSVINHQQTIGFLQTNPSEVVVGSVPVTVLNKSNYPAMDQFHDRITEVVGLNLTVPIFNNFQAQNTSALARLSIQNAQLNERAVKEQLRKTIETAVTDMLASENEFLSAQQALKAEERTFQNMGKKFEGGVLSATDFLIEKSNYLKSEQSLIQAKYNLLLRTKIVDFYLGKPITIQ